MSKTFQQLNTQILRASSLQKVMQNIESHVVFPLLNPRTNPPPPFPFFFLFAFS